MHQLELITFTTKLPCFFCLIILPKGHDFFFLVHPEDLGFESLGLGRSGLDCHQRVSQVFLGYWDARSPMKTRIPPGLHPRNQTAGGPQNDGF